MSIYSRVVVQAMSWPPVPRVAPSCAPRDPIQESKYTMVVVRELVAILIRHLRIEPTSFYSLTYPNANARTTSG